MKELIAELTTDVADLEKEVQELEAEVLLVREQRKEAYIAAYDPLNLQPEEALKHYLAHASGMFWEV